MFKRIIRYYRRRQEIKLRLKVLKYVSNCYKSPIYGIPIDVTYQDVLNKILESSKSNSND